MENALAADRGFSDVKAENPGIDPMCRQVFRQMPGVIALSAAGVEQDGGPAGAPGLAGAFGQPPQLPGGKLAELFTERRIGAGFEEVSPGPHHLRAVARIL